MTFYRTLTRWIYAYIVRFLYNSITTAKFHNTSFLVVKRKYLRELLITKPFKVEAWSIYVLFSRTRHVSFDLSYCFHKLDKEILPNSKYRAISWDAILQNISKYSVSLTPLFLSLSHSFSRKIDIIIIPLLYLCPILIHIMQLVYILFVVIQAGNCPSAKWRCMRQPN